MHAVDGQDQQGRVIQRQDDRFRSVHWAVLILLGAALAFAPAVTSRFRFVGFLCAYAIAAIAWLFVARRSLSLPVTIAIGLTLRALLLFAEPQLSGDVHRYLSDGRVVAGGGNPYAYTPVDPRINHPEVRSIYPPAAQLLFGAVHDLAAWRVLLILVDVATIALLRGRGALAYATCPLVIVEGTWNGHIDLIAGTLLVVALLRGSGVAAGLAAGLKVIPAAALPALMRSTAQRWRFIVAFLAALALPALPFLGGPIMPGMRDYATRWIFNSPAYDLVRLAVDRVPTKEIWTAHPLRFELWSDFVYRWLYPDFVTRAVLATIAVACILVARRVTTAVSALLMFSPALHPWYWLTIVPSALVERSRWVYVALVAPVSYLLYEGVGRGFVYVWLVAVVYAVMPERAHVRD